jgi:hypothetical protein
VIAKWHPQVFMYIPQDILNSDTNTRVAGSFDADNLGTPSEVLQFQRLHVWVYSGGGYVFLWEIVVVIQRPVNLEFEKILCQYWVYVE